jgi:hypothetical protein
MAGRGNKIDKTKEYDNTPFTNWELLYERSHQRMDDIPEDSAKGPGRHGMIRLEDSAI